MTKRRSRLTLTYILTFLVIAFIWYNSTLPVNESSQLSSFIEEWLLRLLRIESLPFNIRKLAHFAEYAALGALAALLLPNKQALSRMRIYCHISVGLFVAVIDESIQILSGRGPMVIDILLDFGGYLTGFSLALIFLLVFRPKRAQ